MKTANLFPEDSYEEEPLQPVTSFTGRFMITPHLDQMKVTSFRKFFESEGLKVAQAGDFDDISQPILESDYQQADVMLFEDMGVGILGIDPDKSAWLMNKSHQLSFYMEPEELIVTQKLSSAAEAGDSSLFSEEGSTWGLHNCGVLESEFTGRGVKVAILDTGFEMDHDDFEGRTIVAKSFVPGETVDDSNGHGTHCTGIACGDTDEKGIRYGIAKNAEIFIGKVLKGTHGRGPDSWTISAINWAANNGCDVINVSLGTRVFHKRSFKKGLERAAKYANSKGALVIAAAGNHSARQYGFKNPIGSPANCPSVMAVAAVDKSHKVYFRSNSAEGSNDSMDMSGPGVKVYSSWLTSKGKYRTLSATSMAAPHVTGIAALYAEKFQQLGPESLWQALKFSATHLGDVNDFGAGLVKAP
ncbi:subtilisin-like serine protease [Moorena producens 3L]|uniref:Subtilisin-like serine protease n=1 Tax=Moorena producens 3L TaxID=489825 RepID=F4XPE6_9CYAN|nr:S8 family serine peptidase [Moorena producens]EGJ33536.1 subtilisin-like serine protease [Moorena producens 3L]OLT53508.1 hypothetical protein BI334_33170 [Moorena producens 3L]